MKTLWNRAMYVVKGDDGASNVEIIVWISVVLMIATLLFAFKDKIAIFLGNAGNKVGGLQVS
jgi:hypothetical protein